MKLISILTVMVLSLPAFGQIQSNDEIVENAQNLPALSNAKIVIIPGPPMADVEPTMEIKFSHSSCSIREYKINTIETQKQLFVYVVDTGLVDCDGPEKSRNYRKQLSSSKINKSITVMNPVAPQYQKSSLRPNPRRMCTAIFGYLVDKDTGICNSFSNGCVRADMLASGNYRAPVRGECQSINFGR